MLREWDDLPAFMKIPEVKVYWEILNKKRGQLLLKRVFDFVIGIVLSLILIIPMIIIAIIIKIDSPGPVFYRQERVTAYGKIFRIHKFRTMISDADKLGTAVTVNNDNRITKVGAKLRKYRLDEIPQVFDVLTGDMSFVGTRPEALKYVKSYKPVFLSTLLMPAGITSEASIRYKDESKLLSNTNEVDKVYVTQVVPAKMKWNLESIRRFGFFKDILTMFRTIFVILGMEFK